MLTLSRRQIAIMLLIATFSLIGLSGGLAVPVHAQMDTEQPDQQPSPHEIQRNGGGGMWGLFGLLGLVGIVGLVPRSPRRVLADPLAAYPAAHQPFVPRQAEAPMSSRRVDIETDVAADIAADVAVRGGYLDSLERAEPATKVGWPGGYPEQDIGEWGGMSGVVDDIQIPQAPLPSTQDYDDGDTGMLDASRYTGTLDVSAATPRWPRRHYR